MNHAAVQLLAVLYMWEVHTSVLSALIRLLVCGASLRVATAVLTAKIWLKLVPRSSAMQRAPMEKYSVSRGCL